MSAISPTAHLGHQFEHSTDTARDQTQYEEIITVLYLSNFQRKTVVTKYCRFRQMYYPTWSNLQNKEWQILPHRVKDKLQSPYKHIEAYGTVEI